ncbi:sigma-54 dependent transcriptional regulator [Proteiniborus sp.]|uniref:sigma-54-dependent transcriptional regulator n=1 Tax=Proteiniborus sp. TaxID=2079015 RepID=UPI00332A2FD5
MNKLLIIDDDISICESLKYAFKKKYELFFAHEPVRAMEYFNHNDIDVILLDLKLGKWNGMDLYYSFREQKPNAIVIIMTAFGTIKSSIEAIKKGVFNYITKPIDLTELEVIIEKGIELNNLYKKVNYLGEELRKKHEQEGIVANSDNMKVVLSTVNKVKDIESNVLITGESGTGKEVIARAIHYQGKRKNNAFHAINCSAIPSSLLESELFGYEVGAFTGAVKAKKGYFEMADKGTLLLDEIGEMEPLLQSKLLRVIQEKEVIPLGSSESKKIDVRILAATNRDLKKAVEKGIFREDLYYRLNVINIHLPPLRERKEDIPYLIEYFVRKYNRILNKNIKDVSAEFINSLCKYEYKGNIRELENIIERAIALSEEEELTVKDIPQYILKNQTPVNSMEKLIPVFIGESLKEIEKRVIKTTYESFGHNQKETAKVLGITARTIRNKLRDMGSK